MALYDWIAEYVLPLFGDLPTVSLDLGNFGTLTIENIIQIMFWVVLGWVVINILVIIPYEWICKLMGRRKHKK